MKRRHSQSLAIQPKPGTLRQLRRRILPTTDTPGANEAGVIYFIDRAFGEEMKGHNWSSPASSYPQFNIEISEGRFADLDEAVTGRVPAWQMQNSPLFNMMWAMTMFGFFAMPKYGGNQDKVGWELVGFEGDHGPMDLPVRLLRRRRCTGSRTMANETTFNTRDEVDFVVIGSGSAGGILAKELSTAGFSTVVLEQGPYRKASDFHP